MENENFGKIGYYKGIPYTIQFIPENEFPLVVKTKAGRVLRESNPAVKYFTKLYQGA